MSDLFDASEVIGALEGLRRYLVASREFAATSALEAMQEAFDQAEDPGTGRSWPPIAESTRLTKSGQAPLVQSGRLRRSLRRGAPGNIYRVGRGSIQVGTSDPNAAFHQHGTSPYTIVPRAAKALHFGETFATRVRHPGLKKRPVVGISRQTAKLIERAMAADAERAMSRGAR
jgi:phage gpG-like protein